MNNLIKALRGDMIKNKGMLNILKYNIALSQTLKRI
jgi:hypothetical protein